MLRRPPTLTSTPFAANAAAPCPAVAPDGLLRRLADGRPHTLASLIERTSLPGAELRRQVAELERWGLEILEEPGEALRVSQPLDLLDADALLARVPGLAARSIERLELFTTLDSTNARLLAAPPPSLGMVNVCIAEYQHAGRGRRGRSWNVPPAAGLCLSAAARADGMSPGFATLALAAGVAARRAVARVANVQIALKWPNDLAFADRKLGGILVEHASESGRNRRVVVGLGINVAVPAGRLAALSDWPRGAVDLAEATGGVAPSRVELAAALIAELVDLFARFEESGFAAYRDELTAADALRGRRIRVLDGSRTLHGTAAGIDPDGTLVVETADGERRCIVAGDVSVRPEA